MKRNVLGRTGLEVSALGLGGHEYRWLHAGNITESGCPVWQDGVFVRGQAGIDSANEEDTCIAFDVGSGYYVFRQSIDR